VIEGEQLRHFPDTDELEIDTVRLTLTAPDGRITHATARQALAAGDGSVARLEGDAKVVSQGQGTELPVEMTGQRLVALIHDQQITTDQAVSVRQGNTEFHADALEFDNQTRQLTLHGKFHAVFAKPALKR
jgi:lipopolysaccharide export system protein LptC